MKPLAIAIPLLALLSCDKAGKIAGEASSAVREKVSQAASAAKDQVSFLTTENGGTHAVDPELEKLVDRTEEGARFRKDLPFPTRLEINTTLKSHGSTRLFEASAIEKRAGQLKGVMISTTKYERAGDHVRVTRGEISLTDPSAKDQGGQAVAPPDNPIQTLAASPPRSFRRKNGAWQADESAGFAVAALSKDLAPVFNLLLEENGLAPRPMWFGTQRVKVGDEIAISGKSLAMLVAGETKGTLRLKLESFDAVSGHPCGVFTVSGDYSRKRFPDFDGKFTDEDVTIQSGRVWLSMIHPVVLKWDIDTIHTYRIGEKGGPSLRGQGSSKITTTNEWKTLPR